MTTAQPIENMVWCEYCGTTHDATFEVDGSGYLHISDGYECEALGSEFVKSLPDNWDRTFVAHFADNGYNLFEKSPSLLPGHRPMYYLESTGV